MFNISTPQKAGLRLKVKDFNDGIRSMYLNSGVKLQEILLRDIIELNSSTRYLPIYKMRRGCTGFELIFITYHIIPKTLSNHSSQMIPAVIDIGSVSILDMDLTNLSANIETDDDFTFSRDSRDNLSYEYVRVKRLSLSITNTLSPYVYLARLKDSNGDPLDIDDFKQSKTYAFKDGDYVVTKTFHTDTKVVIMPIPEDISPFSLLTYGSPIMQELLDIFSNLSNRRCCGVSTCLINNEKEESTDYRQHYVYYPFKEGSKTFFTNGNEVIEISYMVLTNKTVNWYSKPELSTGFVELYYTTESVGSYTRYRGYWKMKSPYTKNSGDRIVLAQMNEAWASLYAFSIRTGIHIGVINDTTGTVSNLPPRDVYGLYGFLPSDTLNAFDVNLAISAKTMTYNSYNFGDIVLDYKFKRGDDTFKYDIPLNDYHYFCDITVVQDKHDISVNGYTSLNSDESHFIPVKNGSIGIETL